jgi:hypothetical protein
MDLGSGIRDPGSGVRDPGSEIRKPFSDPGSRGQKGTGSRIRSTGWWSKFTRHKVLDCTLSNKIHSLYSLGAILGSWETELYSGRYQDKQNTTITHRQSDSVQYI